MKHLANLTLQRIFGGGFAIDDQSFAIIGGNSDSHSNVFELFKTMEFSTKNSTLPLQVHFPCFATTPNMDVSFLAALTNDKRSFLAEISKSTLGSTIIPFQLTSDRRYDPDSGCHYHRQVKGVIVLSNI